MKRQAEASGALIWFRNDLRLHDNVALTEAIRYVKGKQGSGSPDCRLVGIYVFSEDEMATQKLGHAKVDLIARSLKELKMALGRLGVPLVIKTIPTGQEYDKDLVSFCHQNGIDSVFMNRETDPEAQSRDASAKRTFDAEGICYQDFPDQCVVTEGFVLTKAGKPYGMFTPFKNSWIAYLKEKPLSPLPEPSIVTKDPVKVVGEDSWPDRYLQSTLHKDLRIAEVQNDYKAGEAEALSRLESFLASTGPTYDETRNYPALLGTSRLSAYLAIGCVSPRLAVERSRQVNQGKLDSGKSGLVSFISELCWRDFYRHILHHYPHVTRGASFKPEAKNIEWRSGPDAEADFLAWSQGRTGVPIVDAAVRQLLETAWMHNRLRMIVSMYLTKHLLISWKRGEEFFARYLIDYDFASNNGGWQWSASTGTDSQPYFRIFNPYTQSQNYDKDGHFIKKFLPELMQVPTSAIHNPNEKLSPVERARLCPKYASTLVEHTLARNRALQVFKTAFKKL